MLKDAFQYLVELGRAGAAPVVTTTAEPPHVYYLREPDGTLRKVHGECPPDSSTAHSLQAILAVARVAENCEIWYGPGAVVCVYGDDMRSQITLPLALSEHYLKLSQWAALKPQLSQADLVRELRVTFRNCLGPAGSLVEVLRRVNFKSVSATDGEVGHGKASLGKQIAGEVTGAGAIPEYVTFEIPLFANACFRSVRARVECALDPDAATGTFRVIPIPGQLDAALDQAVGEIGESLRVALDDTEIGIFHGKP